MHKLTPLQTPTRQVTEVDVLFDGKIPSISKFQGHDMHIHQKLTFSYVGKAVFEKKILDL